jgi:predicted dehydrogenase
MLREVRPDAVSICTPNGVHAAPAIDAAKRRLSRHRRKADGHERPMNARRMIDASHKAGKKLSVGFQYRYHPNTRFLIAPATTGASEM